MVCHRLEIAQMLLRLLLLLLQSLSKGKCMPETKGDADVYGGMEKRTTRLMHSLYGFVDDEEIGGREIGWNMNRELENERESGLVIDLSHVAGNGRR